MVARDALKPETLAPGPVPALFHVIPGAACRAIPSRAPVVSGGKSFRPSFGAMVPTSAQGSMLRIDAGPVPRPTRRCGVQGTGADLIG